MDPVAKSNEKGLATLLYIGASFSPLQRESVYTSNLELGFSSFQMV